MAAAQRLESDYRHRGPAQTPVPVGGIFLREERHGGAARESNLWTGLLHHAGRSSAHSHRHHGQMVMVAQTGTNGERPNWTDRKYTGSVWKGR